MQWFYDLKISAKLVFGFVLVAAIAGVIGIIGISNLNTVANNSQVLYEHVTVPLSDLADIAVAFQQVRIFCRDMILAEKPEDIQKNAEKITEMSAVITQKCDSFEKTILTQRMRDAFEEFKQTRVAYRANLAQMTELAKANKDAEAFVILRGEAVKNAGAENLAINKLQQMEVDNAKQKNEANAAAAQSATSLMLISLALGVAAAIGLGIFNARVIGSPLKKAAHMMEEMGKGHLSDRLKMDQKDEVGLMGKAMDDFAEDLQKVVIGAMQKIAEGDVNLEVTSKDRQDEISPALKKTIESLKGLIAEGNMLAKAAVEGKLETRGNTSQFKGGYKQIVEGFNQTLDAVVAPINEAAAVLEKVSARNLAVHMEGAYKGDFAKIKNSMNQAIENLNEALSQVTVGAEQVASAAGQISSGAQSLSQGASEQAGSLEEVSSSLQEMTSMTKQNTANAKEARSLSEGARSSSERGVDSMKRLSTSIDKIKASSDATAKIVKTIDEIAFQTNLLALNAAVEAARAGDAGKGFAVVAEEVRNLAMRSAEAAKNTANLIEESVTNAEGGVAINQEVLKNLDEINGQIKKVSEVMAEIAAASEQQSQGVDQINTAVEQMNQVTQQVAANAEESASAAEQLSSQATEMQSMVAGFQLSNESATSTRVTVRPRKDLGVNAPKAPVKKLALQSKTSRPNGGLHAEAKKLIPFGEDADQGVLKNF